MLGEPYNPGDLSVVSSTILDIWTPKPLETGKWFLGVICRYERAGNMREEGIAISVRGVLLWLGLLGAAAYAAGARSRSRSGD